MAKDEVLEALVCLRKTGDERYWKYGEVHQLLKARGIDLSYVSVWRALNGLWWRKEIEIDFEENGLQRTARFRAPRSSCVQVSHLKRVNNILQAEGEKSRSGE